MQSPLSVETIQLKCCCQITRYFNHQNKLEPNYNKSKYLWPWACFFCSLLEGVCNILFFKFFEHGLRTPREEIDFTARPRIQSQSQIFRYGGSIFCLPHRPNFSDIFDLCLHWVSVVRALVHREFLRGSFWDCWGDMRLMGQKGWSFGPYFLFAIFVLMSIS